MFLKDFLNVAVALYLGLGLFVSVLVGFFYAPTTFRVSAFFLAKLVCDPNKNLRFIICAGGIITGEVSLCLFHPASSLRPEFLRGFESGWVAFKVNSSPEISSLNTIGVIVWRALSSFLKVDW